MSSMPREVRLEDENERILTLKINLEGPAELVSWIRENTPPRIRRCLFGFLPAEFRKHMRAARRERLLAVRGLLDAMIERLEKEETAGPKRAVDVQVE